MKVIKPLQLIILSLITVTSIQAQVGEKFYGRASYYADKFHGRNTSSGELYDREEYTAAHRELPFNTIVEIVNKTNQRVAVVKINDRGPFAYNRMIDLSFAAARDLELLGSGEAEVEMRVLSMDKPEYTITNFLPGQKGEFNQEFKKYLPIQSRLKDGRISFDSTTIAQTVIPSSIQTRPVANTFIISDSLRKEHEEGDKLGFRQHKYIRVIKDGDGHYRLDSSIVIPPTPQEYYSVAPKISKQSNVKKPVAVISTTNTEKPKTLTSNQPIIENTTTTNVATAISGFRQYKYVKVYYDEEGRVRIDTTKNVATLSAQNTNTLSESSKPIKETISAEKSNSISEASVVSTPVTAGTSKPKEIYKDGFRQHPYVKVSQDKDGKVKINSTGFEPPQKE